MGSPSDETLHRKTEKSRVEAYNKNSGHKSAVFIITHPIYHNVDYINFMSFLKKVLF